MEITGCRKNKSKTGKESSPLLYFPGSISRGDGQPRVKGVIHLNRKEVAFHKDFIIFCFEMQLVSMEREIGRELNALIKRICFPPDHS